jgi:D-amino peptidase
MTRVLISADMEGITGVAIPTDVDEGSDSWKYFREFMAGDVNAAIEGFYEAGATDVIVNEAHSRKHNIPLGSLDDRASMIIGTHKRLGMMEGLERDIDAVAFIGYHTAAGQQGVLSHTNIGAPLLGVTVNGRRASEGHINALLAAEFHAPVVLFTGDDLACADALTWAPAAKTVAVKRCVDRYTAECLPPARTAPMIRSAAAEALAQVTAPEPPQTPVTIEVEFSAMQAVAAVDGIPGVEEVGERRVSFTSPTMLEASRCLRAVNTLASASSNDMYG